MAEGFKFNLNLSLDEGAVEEIGTIERDSRQANDIYGDPSASRCSLECGNIVSNLIQHLRDEGYSVSLPCNQCNNVIINDSDFVEGQDTFYGSFVSQTRQDSEDQDDISRIEADIEGTHPPNRTEGRYRIILDYFYDADQCQQPLEESSINKLLHLLDSSQEDYGKAGYAAVLKEVKPLLRSIFCYLMNLRNRRAPKPVPRKVKVNKDPLEKGSSSDSGTNTKKFNLTFEDLGPSAPHTSKSSESELDRVVNMVVKMRESERVMFQPGMGLVPLNELKRSSDEDQEDSDSSHLNGRERTMSAYSRSLSVYADDYAVGRSPVPPRATPNQDPTLGMSEGASGQRPQQKQPHTPQTPSPLSKEMECVDEDGTGQRSQQKQPHTPQTPSPLSKEMECVDEDGTGQRSQQKQPHTPQTPSPLNKEMECVDEDGTDDQETLACVRDPQAKATRGPLQNATCEDASCVSGPIKTWSNDGGRQDAGSAMSTNTTADSRSVEIAITGGATDSKTDGLASSQPLLRTPLEHKKGENGGKELTVLTATSELLDSQPASPLPLPQKEASPNVNTVPTAAAHPIEIRANIPLADQPQSNFLATQPTTPEPVLVGTLLPIAQGAQPITIAVPKVAGLPLAAGTYEGTFIAEKFLPDSFGRVVGDPNDEQQRLREQSVSLVETALVNALGQITGGGKKQLDPTESSSTLVTALEGEDQFDIDVQMTVEGNTINRLIKTCPTYPLRDDLDLNLKDPKGKVTVYSQFKNLTNPAQQDVNVSASAEDNREGHNSNFQQQQQQQQALFLAERRTSSCRSDDFTDSQRSPLHSEMALGSRHASAIHDIGEDSFASATETECPNVARPIPRRRHHSLLRSAVSDCTETCRSRNAGFSSRFLARLANIRLSPRGSSAPRSGAGSRGSAGGFNSNNNAVYKVEGDTYYLPPRCRCAEATRDNFLRWCQAFEQCLLKKGLQGAPIDPRTKKTRPNLPLNGWPLRRCHSTCTCTNSRLCDPLIEAYNLFRPYWSTHRNVYEPDHCLLRHKKCTGQIPPSIRYRRPPEEEAGDEEEGGLDCTPHTAPCPPPRRSTSQSPPPVCPPRKKCSLEILPTVTGQLRVGDFTRTFAADCGSGHPQCGPATEPPSSGSFHTADAMSIFVDLDLGSMRCGHKRSASPSPNRSCKSVSCRHRVCPPTPPPPIMSRHVCCQEPAVLPMKSVDKCAGIKPKVVPPCTSRLGPSARTQTPARCSQQVRAPAPCAARHSRSSSAACCADATPQKHCEPKHPPPQTTTGVTTQCPESLPCPPCPTPQPMCRSRSKQPGTVKPRTRSLHAGEGPATLPSWMMLKPIRPRTRPCLDSFLQCRLQHESTCFMARSLSPAVRARSLQPAAATAAAMAPHASPVSPSSSAAAEKQPEPACQLKHYVIPARSPNPYLDRLWKMTNSPAAMNPTPENGSNYHFNTVRRSRLTQRAGSSETCSRRRNSKGDTEWCVTATASTDLFDSLCVHVVEHSASKDSVKVRLRPRVVAAGSHRRAVSAEGPYLEKAVETGDRPGGLTTSVFRTTKRTGLRNAHSYGNLTGDR